MRIDVKYLANVPYFVVADGTVVESEGVAVTLAPEPAGKPAVTAVHPLGVSQFICQSSFDELRADMMKGAN